MTAVVIGASTGLGRALATELARAGYALVLIASDQRDLAALASDIQLRYGVEAHALALDLERELDAGDKIRSLLSEMPLLRAVLLPIGYSRNDDDFSLETKNIQHILNLNLHIPLIIAHALLPALTETHGVIVGFGSIAAVRGRSKNIVYSAAKRGLVSFFESLRHRYTPAQLRVQFWQLGFLRTNLTYGMKLPLPAADPEVIARTVIRRLPQRSRTGFLPGWWALIALVLRMLPWPFYRKVQ